MAKAAIPDYFGTDEQPNSADGSGVNTDVSSGSIVDPASLAGTLSDAGTGEPVKRKRGRPPGSGGGSRTGAATGTAKKKETPNLGFLSGVLITIHAAIAVKTGIEEIAIDQAEADKLSNATSQLAGHYGVAVSEKTEAWMNFVSAIGQVYGTRIIGIVAAAKAKGQEQAPTDPNIAGVVSLVRS